MNMSIPAPPPVVRSAWVARPPQESFAIFTEEIGAWWPLPTHGLFGERSGGVAFRDGLLVEQAIDGTESVWGEVVAWEPPNRLVVTWHPGNDADSASEVEVSFEPSDGGTNVVLEHRGWSAFGHNAMLRRRGYAGPNAWGYVLDHYADGAEHRSDPVALEGLTAVYESFFAEAERGGFGDAPPGEWNAGQVLAHMTLNDAAIVAVCQSLVHQKSLRFENQICQDPAVLQAWIQACGSQTTLIERCRISARQVLAALARLSPEQLATEIDCYLTHDGQVALDQPMPWQAVAVRAQTGVHVPAHIEQLQNLR